MKTRMFCYGASISCTLALLEMRVSINLHSWRFLWWLGVKLCNYVLSFPVQGKNFFLKYMLIGICIFFFKAPFSIYLNIYRLVEAQYKVHYLDISFFVLFFFFLTCVLELL
jgi:hypothetical protein